MSFESLVGCTVTAQIIEVLLSGTGHWSSYVFGVLLSCRWSSTVAYKEIFKNYFLKILTDTDNRTPIFLLSENRTPLRDNRTPI
jgi:hypothetical protein